ncbi:ParB N-terminal domain-containing protein [Luteolibacter flavescens]|uniref:ParB N-terminal domain-containing protein n=1 Tax=Luteolibacter flavescens TaxID=1859460 RepID=A0ABT3FQ84_9BACT|nr:ParB N-terminal domain-containing protein [Luteolibacter flavescens]MCW1885607.1 ParB N-terminal domain-containing protein [Luteolibacter flavescens]
MRDPSALVEHPRNPNRHPKKQIELLARIIRHQGWRNPIVVSARSGFVIAGHGRLAAARFLGLTAVPVDVQEFETEADEWAHLVADNRIAELANMDEAGLGELLRDLGEVEDFDLDLTGFDDEALADLMGDGSPAEGEGAADPAVTGRGLVGDFGAAPFSVFDARSGAWLDRKRAWIESGIASSEGRAEELAFSTSSQPQETYDRKAAVEAAEGRKLGWKEFAQRFPEAMKQTGTSIFDPVLAEIALRWWCPAGGRVLDPFAGGSVRGLVSAKLGMHYTGIDLRPEQVEANERQAAEFGPVPGSARWITGDSRCLPELIGEAEPFDFMLSCPPYFDLEVYSERPEDLSALGSYAGFLEAYREIIRHACARLAPDAFACWVIGDVRDSRGWFHGLTGDTVRAFEDAGMRLYNDAILLTPAGSLPMRVRGQFEKSRKLGKTHQYVLIFGKGDPAKVAARCTLARLPEDDGQNG